MLQTSPKGVDIEPMPRRAEVWLVAFGPSIGGEVQKARPTVVLRNDTANALLNRVQVVPISSQVARLYLAEAYVSLNGARRKAMADQITTASKQRSQRSMRTLSAEDVAAVARAIRLQLGL